MFRSLIFDFWYFYLYDSFLYFVESYLKLFHYYYFKNVPSTSSYDAFFVQQLKHVLVALGEFLSDNLYACVIFENFGNGFWAKSADIFSNSFWDLCVKFGGELLESCTIFI